MPLPALRRPFYNPSFLRFGTSPTCAILRFTAPSAVDNSSISCHTKFASAIRFYTFSLFLPLPLSLSRERGKQASSAPTPKRPLHIRPRLLLLRSKSMQWASQKKHSLEQQNMRLRLVHFVVLPAQALRDAQPPPLLLPQQLERAALAVEVVARDHLEHVLGQLHVAVFVVVVGVSVGGRGRFSPISFWFLGFLVLGMCGGRK